LKRKEAVQLANCFRTRQSKSGNNIHNIKTGLAQSLVRAGLRVQAKAPYQGTRLVW
jgi:hypothetical protein